MAFSVKTVLHLEAQRSVLLGVVEPLTLNHPLGTGLSFAADHQENRSTFLVMSTIYEITLKYNYYYFFTINFAGSLEDFKRTQYQRMLVFQDCRYSSNTQ